MNNKGSSHSTLLLNTCYQQCWVYSSSFRLDRKGQPTESATLQSVIFFLEGKNKCASRLSGCAIFLFGNAQIWVRLCKDLLDTCLRKLCSQVTPHWTTFPKQMSASWSNGAMPIFVDNFWLLKLFACFPSFSFQHSLFVWHHLEHKSLFLFLTLRDNS